MKIDKDIPYSDQANVLLENFKSFDKQEFEKWFIEKLTIGSNTILMYLLEKRGK